jgi:hypothetical protein
MMRTTMKVLGKKDTPKSKMAIQAATHKEEDSNPGKDVQPRSS